MLVPDNDPRLKGADSSIFMEEAYKRMTDRGYRLGNCDVTLICQKPRVKVDALGGGLVKEKMVGNVASLLHTDVGLVNVKARTHEKVDSVGEAAIGGEERTRRLLLSIRRRRSDSTPWSGAVVKVFHWHSSLQVTRPWKAGGESHERNGRLEMDAGRTFDSLPRTSSKSAKGSSLIGDLDRLRATSGIA